MAQQPGGSQWRGRELAHAAGDLRAIQRREPELQALPQRAALPVPGECATLTAGR